VVSFWWYERPRFEFAGVLPANRRFYGGGTRIRIGDTMLFS
jgi:hypothetical protein